MALLQTGNKTQKLHGVFLMVISGCLCAVLSCFIHWYSERTQYSVPKILLRISLFQLLFALLSSVILCDIKMSIKLSIKDTIDSIHSIKDTRSKRNKRSPISINSARSAKKIILHSRTPSKSISYGSLTTFLSTQHFRPKRTLLNELNEDKETAETSPTKLCFAILSQGIFSVSAICTFIESQTQIHFADAIALKSFSLVIAAILGKLVLGDALSKYHIMRVTIMMVACLLIAQPSIIMQYIYLSEHPLHGSSGYLLAVISAFCTSYTSLFVRIASNVPPFIIIVSQSICNIVGFICMITLWNNERIELYHDFEDIMFAAAGGFILYLYSLTFTKATSELSVGASNMIETGSVMVIGWFIFHEYVNYIAIFGISLCITTIIILSAVKLKATQAKLSYDACATYKYSQGGCEAENDIYKFDEDAKAGYTTLIL